MASRALIALGAAVVALTLASASAGALKPTLRIVRDLPLTVQGSHFGARESVRITVVMGTRSLVKRERAGVDGGFTVRFAGLRLDYCALPLVITARGSRSGVVRAKVPVRECAAP